MLKVTLTYTTWADGKVDTWLARQADLDWLLLKLSMGMHPTMRILSIEPEAR